MTQKKRDLQLGVLRLKANTVLWTLQNQPKNASLKRNPHQKNVKKKKKKPFHRLQSATPPPPSGTTMATNGSRAPVMGTIFSSWSTSQATRVLLMLVDLINRIVSIMVLIWFLLFCFLTYLTYVYLCFKNGVDDFLWSNISFFFEVPYFPQKGCCLEAFSFKKATKKHPFDVYTN